MGEPMRSLQSLLLVKTVSILADQYEEKLTVVSYLNPKTPQMSSCFPPSIITVCAPCGTLLSPLCVSVC